MEKANQNTKSLPDWDKQDEIVRYLNDPGSYSSSQSPKLNVGDFWYIKYPGAIALVEVEIIEVSSKTVVLMQVDRRYTYSGTRYEISDIKFVEKVEKV